MSSIHPPPPEVSRILDEHLPPVLRQRLEQRYWAPIGEAAMVERFIDDPALRAAPDRHPALFSDHGVVHVRDIAAGAALLAQRLHGSLLPPRDDAGCQAVQGLASLLAWFHDIGMVDPTAAGRRVHPQFAAQTVLGADFDALALDLWQADAGGLRTRLRALAAEVPEAMLPLRLLAREVMALSLCHSKSAVPAAWLDDRAKLRQAMQRACFTTLQAQQGGPLAAMAAQGRDRTAPSALLQRYADADAQAFAWLTDPRPALRRFADEVIDAVRVLRAADALRQRGTTLRTSAGYEVCTDRATGEAVMGLRTADQRCSLLLRFHNPISAAEANLHATQIDERGQLRVEFYRGSFSDAAVRRQMLDGTAIVIADIEADALASFAADAPVPPAGRCIELVATADDERFAGEVAEHVAARHPALANRLRVVAGEPTPVAAGEPDWTRSPGVRALPLPHVDDLFEPLARHGLNVAAIDRDAALRGTQRWRVPRGTSLLQPGGLASFVVVPLGPGLVLQPMGGYPAQPLHAWIPLGVTGVVRGGRRNAGVQADDEVDVLLIEAGHYLAEWFRPYDIDGLRRWLAARR